MDKLSLCKNLACTGRQEFALGSDMQDIDKRVLKKHLNKTFNDPSSWVKGILESAPWETVEGNEEEALQFRKEIEEVLTHVFCAARNEIEIQLK